MLFNDTDFIKYISDNFVGVASDDVAYNNAPQELKSRREYVFLDAALRSGKHSVHQGVYAITASGVFLGKIDTGWPTYDPIKSLENLRAAKSKYDELDKSQRVGSLNFTEKDRSLIHQDNNELFGGTKLITTARHYPFAEMELFDSRHPEYSKRDSLWFSSTETKGLLPPKLEEGASADVSKVVVERLLLHGHLMFGCPAWWTEHIKQSQLQVTVSGVSGNKIHLRYEGKFEMIADSRWNKSNYAGNLMGGAVWDTSKNSFDALEWVAIGDRALQELQSNLHRGNTKTTKVASYIRLANKSSHEQQLVPHKWDEYPKAMKQER